MNSPGLNMGTPEGGKVHPENVPTIPEISPPSEIPPRPPQEANQDKNPEELIPSAPKIPEIVGGQQVPSTERIQVSPINTHLREQDITEGPMLDVTDADRLAETVNQISNQ